MQDAAYRTGERVIQEYMYKSHLKLSSTKVHTKPIRGRGDFAEWLEWLNDGKLCVNIRHICFIYYKKSRRIT